MLVENVRRCDRCKKLYEMGGEPTLKIKRRQKVGDDRVVSMVELDLCPECCDELVSVLDMKQTTVHTALYSVSTQSQK